MSGKRAGAPKGNRNAAKGGLNRLTLTVSLSGHTLEDLQQVLALKGVEPTQANCLQAARDWIYLNLPAALQRTLEQEGVDTGPTVIII